MAKSCGFRHFGFLFLALLMGSLAGAKELSADGKAISPDVKTTSDQVKIKDLRADSNISAEVSKVQKLKMTSGGSDSGGGGQGVYDIRTGQVHFVDIFSREDLDNMQLARNPERFVFAKFPKCTKTASWMLPQRYQKEAIRGPEKVTEGLGSFLGFNKQEFTYMTQGGLWRLLTAFHLKQLKDATGVAPEFQIQLAIYKNGITYFQRQALELMPFEEFKWLMVKESLRYFATYRKIHVDNTEIEEILKFMYLKNGPAVAETTYFLKLIRPNFEMDTKEILIGKKQLIENRLKTAALSTEERALWQQDLADINFKESKDFREFLVPQRLRLNRLKMTAYTIQPENEGYQTFIESLEKGIIPAWALKFPQVQQKSVNEAPLFSGYNVETGEAVVSLEECSK